MSVIGEQIKLYRIENNMTQETLGQLVGVTTQAISRWERGGTPDAELLPRIAEVLGVSVDALFGLEKQNIAVSLARRLCGMTQAEAFRYAFDVCWAIEVGLAGNASAIDDFVNRFAVQSIVSDEQTKDYFAKTVLNEGMANARISPGLSHFFLMLQPNEGVGKCLSDFESRHRADCQKRRAGRAGDRSLYAAALRVQAVYAQRCGYPRRRNQCLYLPQRKLCPAAALLCRRAGGAGRAPLLRRL